MKLNCLSYGALIAIFLPIFCHASENDPGSNQHPLSFGSDQTIVDLSKITWEPLKVAGLPSGAEIAVLRGDLVTGGSESILKLPPNYRMPSHNHTSDELYVWIQGSFTLISHNGSEINFSGPAYISFPGNAPPHGLKCGSKQQCMLYLRLSRSFDIKYQSTTVTGNQ